MRRAAFSVTNVLIMQVTKIMTIVPLSISSLKSPMSWPMMTAVSVAAAFLAKQMEE
jgi:hypothetical protein